MATGTPNGDKDPNVPDGSEIPAAGAGEQATDQNAAPGSSSADHPHDGIPLPEHGFDTLDQPVRELADIPAIEVISRAAVMLMSAAAEKLGLAPGEEPQIDLDEARRLIEALAGLLAASQAYLGPHRQPLREGLRALQKGFREASAYPDEPGQGPGEALLR